MLRSAVLLPLLLAPSAALVLSNSPWCRAPTAPRAAHLSLCAEADPEAKLRDAAARVVQAAAQFGEGQGKAAAEWVNEAISARSGESGEMDMSELMEKQMALFDECLVRRRPRPRLERTDATP